MDEQCDRGEIGTVRLGQWIGFLCLVISLVILWQIRGLLLLVFAAVVLSTALNSLARRLQQVGIRRGLAVATTLLGFIIATVLFVGLIVPPFIDQFVSLLELLPRGVEQVIDWIEILIEERPEFFGEQLEFSYSNLSQLVQQVQPLAQNLLENFFTFFQSSFLAVGQFLLVLVLSIMLLTNPTSYRQAFIQLFPSFYRRRADEILIQCEIALCSWSAGFIMSSIFVAVLSAVGLYFLGIRLVLAHALLAGVFNLIPNIGPTLSTVFPITIALIDAPWKAIAVIILYVVIQNLESYLFTPAVMAKQVSLLPAMTLIAQIFFTSMFGLIGLLLALPLTVVAKIWIQESVIKDILDQWQYEPQPAGIAPIPKPSPSSDHPQMITEDVMISEPPASRSNPDQAQGRSPRSQTNPTPPSPPHPTEHHVDKDEKR